MGSFKDFVLSEAKAIKMSQKEYDKFSDKEKESLKRLVSTSKFGFDLGQTKQFFKAAKAKFGDSGDHILHHGSKVELNGQMHFYSHDDKKWNGPHAIKDN